MKTVDWQFWRKQKQAMEYASSGDYDITVFLGGYRSGKSVTGARWLLKQALKNPDGDFLMMAVDYAKGKKTTYPVLFEDALPGDKLNPFKGGNPENSPVVDNWTKDDRALVLTNGSTITPAGADEEGRYEGGSFNAVWLDEPGLYKDKLDGVASTLLERMDGGLPGTAMWTTTGKTGALQRIIERREWSDGSSMDNPVKIVKASTENNPFLPERTLTSLKNRYKNSVNEGMALHGEFGDVEGRVYPNFQRETHVRPRQELLDMSDENKRRVYGYDAGWDDERVVLEACIGHDGSVYVVDEFYESEKFVEDAINWVKDKPKGRIYCEHEPDHIQKFNRNTSHRAEKASKSIDAGIDAVRNRIQKNGLMVAEECENTVKEFVQYQKDDISGTNVSDHAMDSLRYLVMGVENSTPNKASRVTNPFAV